MAGLILAVRFVTRSGDSDTPTTAVANTGEQPSVPAVAETNPSTKSDAPTTEHPTSDAPPVSPSAEKNSDVAAAPPAIADPPKTDPPANTPATDATTNADSPPAANATVPRAVPQPAEMQTPPAANAVANSSTEKPAAVADNPPATADAQPPKPADQAPPGRTLQRVAPRIVNVAARLTGSIHGLEVRGQPLASFLDVVSDLSTIPITIDCNELLEMGQSPAVTVRISDATIADTLKAALDPLKLSYRIENGQLIVGRLPQEKLRQVRYTVTDLTGEDNKPLAELSALVRRMVEPESWQAVRAGNEHPSLVAGSGTLLVDQTESAHAQILVFCEKLRVARGLPLKSRIDPARFVLITREDKAHELLNRPLSANFATPQPLAAVMKWLHQTTGATMVIDHAALAAEGISDESECSGAVANKPLSALLDELTNSSELAWRAIDDKTIEITTRTAAAMKMDVEFYSAGDLAKDATAGQTLIAQINSKVEPQQWGDAADKAAIQFDATSRTLIIRAPQRLQSHVESFLADSRAKK